MKKWIIVILLLMLIGCTKHIQPPSEFEQAQLALETSITECLNKVSKNPDIAKLDGLIVSGKGTPSFAMLNNESLIEDSKKPALELLENEYFLCSQDLNRVFTRYPVFPPEFVNVVLSSFQSQKTDLADLWGKKITIGEYNRKREIAEQKFSNDLLISVKNADLIEREKNNAANQVSQNQQIINIQRQRLNIQRQQQWQQPQQSQQKNSIAPVHCSSYLMGNQINTNCY